MEIQQNTLYVMTQGAYLHRDHMTVVVEVNQERKLAVPLHHLQAIVAFGNVLVSPGVMQLCADAGISLTFVTESGRLLSRVDAPVSGNVLLRRDQYRKADRVDNALNLARTFVAGKVQNSRTLLLRAGRESAHEEDRETLVRSAEELARGLRQLPRCGTLDEVRGVEGNAARRYFQAFGAMVRHERDAFAPRGRTRRPPLDRGNALLSFVYALLLADCVAALTAAGLDPNVGYLHADRPGRPGLALDLMGGVSRHARRPSSAHTH